MRVALDTSVVLAGVLAWHEHHRPTLALLQDVLPKGHVVLPAPVLVEAYALLTSLPGGARLAPDVAQRVLDGTFRGQASVVGVTDPEVWWFLEESAKAGARGPATFEAQVAACALKGRATHLATLDERLFERFVAGALVLVNPGRR